MLCAAEIVDAVTLQPVIADIKVRADGLKSKPRISRSGYHYWLEEGDAQPQRIFVDASGSRYDDVESAPPVAPEKIVRIELAPRASYPFEQGVTALRGTLLESRFGAPLPIAGATVLLQWSDGLVWVSAPTRVTSDGRGDFAVPLRLAPRDEPRLIAGGMAVRVQIGRGGLTRTSDEFALRAGQVSTVPQPFIWDDL